MTARWTGTEEKKAYSGTNFKAKGLRAALTYRFAVVRKSDPGPCFFRPGYNWLLVTGLAPSSIVARILREIVFQTNIQSPLPTA